MSTTLAPFPPLTPPSSQASGALIDTEGQRAIQEVQAAMVIAKRFPRDEKACLDRILNSCSRPSLAEQSVYSYARGGTSINGPSIRLAEAVAQQWGNLQFGIRELDQRDGVSTVEAFAWDLETNTREVKVFQVVHERHTSKGKTVLTDPRDIYETVANNGARRLRACILGVIPGDIVDEAVKQCQLTLTANADTSPEAQAKMLEAFSRFKVTKEQIEKRLQRRIDAIQPAQVVSLKNIYASLRDGMSKPEDWFDGAAFTAPTGPPIDPFQKPEPEPQSTAEETTLPIVDDGQEREHLFIDIRETMHAAEITLPRFEALAKEKSFMQPDETMAGGKLPIERMRVIHANRGAIAGLNQPKEGDLI